MELSQSEAAVIDRYYEKTRIAGGAKAGYLLRLDAMRPIAAGSSGVDIDAGVAGLVDKGLLQPNESGDRYYLTEEGAELVAGRA